MTAYPAGVTWLVIDGTLAGASGPVSYPASRTHLEFDADLARVPVDPGEPVRWRYVLVDQAGTVLAWAPGVHEAALQERLGDVERLTFTHPFDGSEAAALLATQVIVPEVEIQVWRGDELRMWGPLVSVDDSGDEMRVTAVGAFEHINRTLVGKLPVENRIVNGDFDQGLSGWGVIRSTGLGTFAAPDPNRYYVSGPLQFASGPVYPPSDLNRMLFVDNYNETEDAISFWQDYRFGDGVPRERQVTLRARFYWPHGGPTGVRNTQDLALSLSIMPWSYWPPLAWYTDVVENSAGTPLTAVTKFEDFPDDRWVTLSCTISIPPGLKGAVHAQVQTPPGASLVTGVFLEVDEALDFYEEDPARIARLLVLNAQNDAYDKQDNNVSATAASCPTSAGPRVSRQYPFSNHDSHGEAVDQLRRDALGEWRMTYTPTDRVFHWRWPRVGGQRAAAKVFHSDDGGNVVDATVGNNWASASTDLAAQMPGGFGMGEEAVRPSDMATTIQWEEIQVAPPDTQIDRLKALAYKLQAVTISPRVISVAAKPASLWSTGYVIPGDTVSVDITSRGRSIDGAWRVLQRDVKCDEDTATVTLGVNNAV